MSKRTEKMYGKSPKIVADENGKKVVRRGMNDAEKKSARVSDGTEGIAIHERQMKEIDDMHTRHAGEHKDMVKRHLKEFKGSVPEGETGAAEIKRIEKNKGA